jgi:carbon monoxide dehydrogenase subunit G
MKLQGKVSINAPREKVWDFLIDPNLVGTCVPGLEELEIIEPGKKFHAKAAVGLGTVKVKFDADVEWLELDPPNRAKMTGHGSAPGSAGDATAEMRLIEGPGDTTELEWEADVIVAGTIASLASRLMKSVSQKLSKTFFECVKKHVEV